MVFLRIIVPSGLFFYLYLLTLIVIYVQIFTQYIIPIILIVFSILSWIITYKKCQKQSVKRLRKYNLFIYFVLSHYFSILNRAFLSISVYVIYVKPNMRIRFHFLNLLIRFVYIYKKSHPKATYFVLSIMYL